MVFPPSKKEVRPSKGLGCLMSIIGSIFLVMTIILVVQHFGPNSEKYGTSMSGKILAVVIVFGIGLFFSVGGFRILYKKTGVLPYKAWPIVGVLFAGFGIFFLIETSPSNVSKAIGIALFFFGMSGGCFWVYNYYRKKIITELAGNSSQALVENETTSQKKEVPPTR